MNAQSPQIQVLQDQWEPEGKEISLQDCWAVFKRTWWLIFVVFVIVVGLTAGYLIRTPRQYEATTAVRIPASGSGGGGGLAAALGAFLPVGSASDIATEMEMIKGRDIAEKAIRTLKLDKAEKNLGVDGRRLVSRFQGRLKVKQRGRTNLIEITVTSVSSEEARDIANVVADEYIQLSKLSSQKEWNDLINQMEAKLVQTSIDLEESRQLLHEREAEEGITTAFSPLLSGGGISTDGYGTQYVAQAVARLEANIMEMEIQLEAMRESLPEADPEVISLKSQIEASKKKLHNEKKKVIEKYDKQFGLTRIAAEVAFNQQLYGSLVSKHEELKAQYILQNKAPEIIEKALEPLYPSSPRRKLILMLGAVLGFFLGLGAALLREFLDNSMHIAQDVTKLIDLPVLGSVPRLKGIKKNQGKDALITYYDAKSSKNKRVRDFYKESYRMFQLELIAAADGGVECPDNIQHQDGLTLLVTSSVSEEGRSTIAANLAISLSQTGKKVLLVDADCRNSIQHTLLDFTDESRNAANKHPDGLHSVSSMGLIDVLAGKAVWNDVVRTTSVDNLYAIASGVERSAGLLEQENGQLDPSTLLLSSHLEEFIKSSRDQFDIIIFDSPSATLASESVAIGSKVDGVVLVVKANDTRKDIVIQAKQRVQNSGGNILGVVLNCVVL